MITVEKIQALQCKLETLERRSRLQSGVIVLLGVTVILPGVTASNPTTLELLQTRQLQLLDDVGRIRARLQVADGATPSLDLLDQSGQPRLQLALGKDGAPEINLNHERGVAQLELSLANGDLPWIHFRNTESLQLANIGLNSYGSPSLELSSGDYRRHVDLRFDPSGAFGFYAYSPDYDDRVRVGIAANGRPTIELCDPKEQPLATLSVDDAAGRPSLELRDRSGKQLLALPGE